MYFEKRQRLKALKLFLFVFLISCGVIAAVIGIIYLIYFLIDISWFLGIVVSGGVIVASLIVGCYIMDEY